MNSLLFKKILTYKFKSEEHDEIKSAIDLVTLIRDSYYNWLLVHYNLKIEDQLNIDPEKFLNVHKFILDVLLDFLIDRIICDYDSDYVHIFPYQHNIKFSRFEQPEHCDIETIIENYDCDKCECELSKEFYYSYDYHLDIEIYICFNCRCMIKLLDDALTPDNTIQTSCFIYKSFEKYKIENSPLEKDKILIYNIEDDIYYYTDEESDYEDNIYSLNIKIKTNVDISELEYQSVIACDNIFNRYANLYRLDNYNEVLEHKLRVHPYYEVKIRFGINEEYHMQGFESFEFMIDNSTDSKIIKNFSLYNFENLDIWAFKYIQNRLNEEYINNNRELYTKYSQGPYKFTY